MGVSQRHKQTDPAQRAKSVKINTETKNVFMVPSAVCNFCVFKVAFFSVVLAATSNAVNTNV